MRRALLVTAATLALTGVLTGCDPPSAGASSGLTAPPPALATPTPAASMPPPASASPSPPGTPLATPWTPATCDWALTALAQDAALDRQAAAAPPDPRWPGTDPRALLVTAAQWDATAQLVRVDCGRQPAGAGVPSCQDAISWTAAAATLHDQDLSRAGITAGEAAWDRGWVAFYRNLAADLGPC